MLSLLLGGRLSAFNRSELCRTRCGEVVCVAHRLTCMNSQARPISSWSSNVVERVFRAHCKRVRRFLKNWRLVGATSDYFLKAFRSVDFKCPPNCLPKKTANRLDQNPDGVSLRDRDHQDWLPTCSAS